MKRIALFAATAFVLAACSAKEEAPVADTMMAAPTAAAPAPAMDSVIVDTTVMAPPVDTAVKH